ncbi:MAG: CDP-diacylglycerol--glycerol-3-phosphate 3-phosphatidyltransferase [Candidatus Cloacimonadaceae bacterium]|nr:CDP-diacylglycerol--glycerol-3-phosphate 3-phosphatidyltransferase [Candidatus Cloacimonadaceae bacterium]MDP3114981.1 CDP-diacylglycerol--glycerol-3-phosphate 3-phosphatidyltransferase [Candidatus Cloacimonadaceae bacterium]
MRGIPNALTLLRVLLIPVFLYYTFSPQGSIAIALIIFAVASFTDFLDGYLARRMKVISNFGKLMDPLADKLLVLSALAGLTWLPPFRLHIAIFCVILVRELAITILREIYKKKGIIVPADKLGKIKTLMQMSGIIAAYALWAWHDPIPSELITIIAIWFWLVAGITLSSGLNYLIGVKLPREES